jgi:large conductance mechanosensitive channel
VEEDLSVRSFLKEFKEFISAGNLIELAVAFILGLAIKAVIDAFIAGVANPIVGAIFGKPNLDNALRFTLRDREGTENDSVLAIGVVLTQIISLILVGLVLFLIVKAYNKMRKKGPDAPVGPTEVELLTDIRDALRARP